MKQTINKHKPKWQEVMMKKRQDIRKQNKGNSFYDVMKPRKYKDNRKYQLVAGITKPQFKK